MHWSLSTSRENDETKYGSLKSTIVTLSNNIALCWRGAHSRVTHRNDWRLHIDETLTPYTEWLQADGKALGIRN